MRHRNAGHTSYIIYFGIISIQKLALGGHEHNLPIAASLQCPELINFSHIM